MEKFTRTIRGYDPDQVNSFLDKIISQVEGMVADIKTKDSKIMELQKLELENKNLKEKLNQYERMEGTFSKAILMAQKTSEQIKVNAHGESETIIENAKKNANRIINEALLKAEKTEQEANMLRRNITIFKRRVKEIVEAQLNVIDELDEVDL
ncbi:MAG: DivIVA domain-containing protein [Bacilli bacterium]